MQLVKTRRDKPPDSSRKPPIKIDHEVVVADDELKGFWSSGIFQGRPGKIIYDGHSLFDLEKKRNSRQIARQHMLELK